jgi:hypothetical protein
MSANTSSSDEKAGNPFQSGKDQIPFVERDKDQDDEAEHEYGPVRDIKETLPATEYQDEYDQYKKLPEITIHNSSTPNQLLCCFS